MNQYIDNEPVPGLRNYIETANPQHTRRAYKEDRNRMEAQGKPELAEHSPLPWSTDADGDIQDPWGNKVIDTQYTYEADQRLIVASVNHAEALAEALRKIDAQTVLSDDGRNYLVDGEAIDKACTALANWEVARRGE